MEILLLVAGGLISWVVAHFYYKRSSSEAPQWAKPLLQNLQETTKRADRAGLLATASQSAAAPDYSFQLVAAEDPMLALAGLRIELEKRLLQLAQANHLDLPRAGIGKLLIILSECGLLTNEERSILADLVGSLNSAVHGRTVDDRMANWALDAGKRLLVGLDRRLEKRN